jgi:hypothetical protein
MHQPTDSCICPQLEIYWRQIHSHDLTFLLEHIFPKIPHTHVYECLKIIWERTYRLGDQAARDTVLPIGTLNLPPFKGNAAGAGPATTGWSQAKLVSTFCTLSHPWRE